MNEQEKANRSQRLHQEQVLYRYSNAFEQCDLAELANIWQEAEQDPHLGQMLFELQQVYQQEEQQEIMVEPIQNIEQGVQPVAYAQPGNFRPQRVAKRKPSRLLMSLQAIAAVVAVGVVVSGFLILFNARHVGGPASTGHKSATVTSSGVVLGAAGNTLTAWSADSGKLLWHALTKSPSVLGGSDSNLVIEGDTAYYSTQGIVYAYELHSGKLLWQQDFHVASDSGIATDQPALFIDQQVLFFNSNYGLTPQTYALRASDGKELWHVASGVGEVSFITAKAGIAYVIAKYDNNQNTEVRAVRSSDGTLLWHYQTNALTGVVANDTLYVRSYLNHQSSQNLVKDTTEKFLALNIQNGEVRWSHDVQGLPHNPIVSVKDEVLFYDSQSLCAYKQSDGSQTWCRAIDDNQNLDNPLYSVTQNTVYVSQLHEKVISSPTPNPPHNGTPNGYGNTVEVHVNVTTYDVGTGKLLLSSQVNLGGSFIHQDYSNGIWIIAVDGDLVALDGQNAGNQLWQIHLPSQSKSSPNFYNQFFQTIAVSQ